MMARLPITPYPTHCRVRWGVGVTEIFMIWNDLVNQT